MIYKIIMMSGQEVMVQSEEALQGLLREANAGKKLVLTKYGVVNVASIDSIVPWRDKNLELARLMDYRKEVNGKLLPQYTPEEAVEEVTGPSPFARMFAEQKKALGERMGIDPKTRTLAQEAGARDERNAKNGQ